MCAGTGELKGAFATLEGEPVEKVVCPRCNGQGRLADDGEPPPKKGGKAR